MTNYIHLVWLASTSRVLLLLRQFSRSYRSSHLLPPVHRLFLRPKRRKLRPRNSLIGSLPLALSAEHPLVIIPSSRLFLVSVSFSHSICQWKLEHVHAIISSGDSFISHSNTVRQRQNGRHFSDVILIRLKVVRHTALFNNEPPLVQIMAWRWTGDALPSELMMTQFVDA